MHFREKNHKKASEKVAAGSRRNTGGLAQATPAEERRAQIQGAIRASGTC